MLAYTPSFILYGCVFGGEFKKERKTLYTPKVQLELVVLKHFCGCKSIYHTKRKKLKIKEFQNIERLGIN